MLDKIVYTNKNYCTLIFTDIRPFTIYCAEGNVLQLASYLLGIDLVPEVTEVTWPTTLKVA